MSDKSNPLYHNDLGFNCSESVVLAFAEKFGLNKKDAVRMACGFGAGMGRMAGVCGAVTGAFMILGLKYGRTDGADKDAKELTYDKVKAFAVEFEKRMDTLLCKELLGHDMNTEEGLKAVKEDESLKETCRCCIKTSVEILTEMI